jgi:KDO2-lipid IV(A) lauroyltransferase
MAKKNNIIINFEYLCFISFYKLIKPLKLKTVYKVASGLAKLAYWVDFRHRRRTIQHLLHAGVVKDNKEAKAMAKKVFFEMAKIICEIFKLDQIINKDNCKEYLKLTGDKETIDKYILNAENNQYIIISAHYGNWEVMSHFFDQFFNSTITSIFRTFENPKIGDFFEKKRSSGGVSKMAPKSGGLKALLKAIKSNDSVCILADQHPGRKSGIMTKFFGQPALTHSSPAYLHLKTAIPIIPLVIRRKPEPGHFDIVIGKAIDYTATNDKDHDVKEITQMFTTTFEEFIRDCPEQWLWCHRRWTNINRKRKYSEFENE